MFLHGSGMKVQHRMKQCSPTVSRIGDFQKMGKVHSSLLYLAPNHYNTQFWNVAFCGITKGHIDTSLRLVTTTLARCLFYHLKPPPA